MKKRRLSQPEKARTRRHSPQQNLKAREHPRLSGTQLTTNGQFPIKNPKTCLSCSVTTKVINSLPRKSKKKVQRESKSLLVSTSSAAVYSTRATAESSFTSKLYLTNELKLSLITQLKCIYQSILTA